MTRAGRLAAGPFCIVLVLLLFLASRPGDVAADSLCDRDGVKVTYDLGVRGEPPAYHIIGVTVAGIDEECFDGQITVILRHETTDVSVTVQTIDSSDLALLLNPSMPASDVTSVRVKVPTVEEVKVIREQIEDASSASQPPPPVVAQQPPPAAEPVDRSSATNSGPDSGGDTTTSSFVAQAPQLTATPDAQPTQVIAAQTPVPTLTPSSTPSPTPAPEPEAVNVNSPELVNNILSISDLVITPEALLSNAGLSAVLLALMLIDTTIFNSILKQNSGYIHSFARRRFGPVLTLFKAGGGREFLKGHGRRNAFLRPFIVLSLSALIYSLLDSNFGWNNTTLVLFTSLFFGLAVATYVNDGGQALIAERHYGIPFTVTFFPAAIVIALVSIGVSRLADIHPGIIFGFVASARETTRLEPTDDQDGVINYFPMVSLLAISIAAWLAIEPIAGLGGKDSLSVAILQASCAMLFVGAIQGLLFTLLPFTFMDGQKIWKWSKLAWLSIALPVMFLFFHIVLNQGATLSSASSSHGIIALYASAIVAWALTIISWFYFRKVNPEGRMVIAEEDLEEEVEHV